MIVCILHFSEGRRREVINALGGLIGRVAGVLLLDTHTDPDHNRSVITCAGLVAAVEEAAFQGVKEAIRLIDMAHHQGVQPRIGAVDMVAFVPLRDTTIEQCVEIARVFGRRLGEELNLPVYLCDAAAQRPEERRLSDLRRGGYEALRDAISRDPQRMPDYGPPRLGSAGATVVSARGLLIAYNIYLNTAELRIARRIARVVRGSSGGLRDVQALGLLVAGRAQIAINLLNYRSTPLHRVIDFVAREAALYGAAIVAGELVGLIPEDALLETGRFYMRLHDINDQQVLERRLEQVAGTAEWWRLADGRKGATIMGSLVAKKDVLDLEPGGGPLAEQAVMIWRLSVDALAAAAWELADINAGNRRLCSMLQALGRELSALSRQTADPDPAGASRALLLIARLAAKLTEALTHNGKGPNGQMAQPQAPLTAHLAHSVAAGARLQALALLADLPLEQRSSFAHEFAGYVLRTRELLARIDPTE